MAEKRRHSLKNKAAIVGVGYTPQGRIPGRTALSFHLEACANAISDAGLSKKDVDGLICYRHFPPASNENDLDAFTVAHHLGIQPSYLYQDANCSRSHLQNAVSVLASGLCSHVLLSYAHNSLSSDSFFFMLDALSGDQGIYGHFGATGGYAMAARRAMHECGTGPETWQRIAVGQRKWAQLNPAAMMHTKPLTPEDYFQSKWIVEPFRLPDNCLVSDGGRAMVLTTVERARDLPHRPAVIMGLGSGHPSSNAVFNKAMAGPLGFGDAAAQALAMAGVTLEDVDACQIYDCFTYTVEAALQGCGFFKPGEGGDWLQGGTIEPGGRMPVNTSGGLLSEAYYMGLTPLSEAAMQLMGRCGKRQLGPQTQTREPNIILCTDNGGILQSQSCCILGRQ